MSKEIEEKLKGMIGTQKKDTEGKEKNQREETSMEGAPKSDQ